MAKLEYMGPAFNSKTNRWLFTCDCGRSTIPEATTFSVQEIICQCGNKYIAHYNERPAKIEIKPTMPTFEAGEAKGE